MLVLSDKLRSVPVMSLQTGNEIARTGAAIIDPRSLTIVALYVSGPQVEDTPAVLHTADIREAGELGFIVDDSTKLMGLDGLVRLQQVIDFKFDIMNCTVYEKSGKKLGKVSDYSFDPDSYLIQQIYIKESFLRRITTTSNIISRTQIVSIDDHKIVVDRPTISAHAAEKTDASTAFVNPFRQSQPQPDRSRLHAGS